MITLATINARYTHSSLGLRYLRANLQNLRHNSQIIEFTFDDRARDICEKLLLNNPSIIGLGVYIWNCELMLQVVKLLKVISPKTIIVLGGPEVSHEHLQQEICALADYTISGYADISFYNLCTQILNHNHPSAKFIRGDDLSSDYLAKLEMPYDEYTDNDIDKRNIYFEASRGCPFKCEFCISSLDKTAYAFPLYKTISALNSLWQKGARNYKFVDRTFNINPKFSTTILDFFLNKLPEHFFTHFEMIPDVLPESVSERLSKFPHGTLQLEIGIQTINSLVQINISRRQNFTKAQDNLQFLQNNTHAHLHTDLIVGLPGETINSFAEGFDWLYKLKVSEIQVGILKRLRGTPIIRHSNAMQMQFNSQAPYEIISNGNIDFMEMQKLIRFARFWDLIGNSGRFKQSLAYLLATNPFENFMKLSVGIFELAQQTQKISLERLFKLIYLVGKIIVEDSNKLLDLLTNDYNQTGARGKLLFDDNPQEYSAKYKKVTPERQKRHNN